MIWVNDGLATAPYADSIDAAATECSTVSDFETMPNEPEKLRVLACWYREFAERTANPTIWEGRLRTAEDLEAEADRLERVAA